MSYSNDFKQLFNGLHDVALLADGDGRIHRANDRALSVLQFSEEEIYKKNVIDFLSGGNLGKRDTLRLICDILKDEKYVFIEASCVRKTGEPIPSDFVISKSVPGNEKLMLFIIKNIATRARMEEKLLHAGDEMEDLIKDLGVLLEGEATSDTHFLERMKKIRRLLNDW